MTDTIFDARKHPRDTTNGEFVAVVKPEPADPLRALGDTSVSSLLPQDTDDVFTFTPAEVGEDQYGPVDYVDLSRDRWRQEENRNPDLVEVKAVHRLNLLNYRDGETETDWEEYLTKNAFVISNFIGHRYGADVDYADHDEDRSAFAEVEARFYLDLPHSDITVSDVLRKVEDQSKIAELAAEADHGTNGTENFGRLMREYVAKYVTGKPGIWFREITEVQDRDVARQVKDRLGKRELTDQVARKIAYDFGGDSSHLGNLGMRGYANKELLRKEMAYVYAGETNPTKRERLDMLFTWIEHGGDNS